jgi:hypothetical protein
MFALPLFIFFIVAFLLSPLAYIWAFNTLFPTLEIAQSFETWLAVILVHAFFHNTITIKRK